MPTKKIKVNLYMSSVHKLRYLKLHHDVLVFPIPIVRSADTTGVLDNKSDGNAPSPDSGFMEVESHLLARIDDLPYNNPRDVGF